MSNKDARNAAKIEQPGLSAGRTERVVSAIIALLVLAAIVYGWFNRDRTWLDPDAGMGYWLGVIGGSMMLILLGYPVRKRMNTRSRAVGSVGFWFRFHMLLGLMGPLTILYHSRFSWGALNSAVALGAMIVVALSGLIGRFIYSHVHRGYSDRKLEMRELKNHMDELLAVMELSGMPHAEVVERLQPYENRAIAAGGNFWSSALAIFSLGFTTRRAHWVMRKQLPKVTARGGARALTALDDFFFTVRRSAEFAFYDRLLRFWHLLHMPLFVLLVAATVLHVVAVHMY
jgi:hypothetical protein